MLTEYEAQKLQAHIRRESDAPAKQRLLRDMRREPAWRLGVVLKCAVCLLILVGLALIGTTTDLLSETPVGAPAAGGPAQHRERASVVEAKKAFDERGDRFDKDANCAAASGGTGAISSVASRALGHGAPQ